MINEGDTLSEAPCMKLLLIGRDAHVIEEAATHFPETEFELSTCNGYSDLPDTLETENGVDVLVLIDFKPNDEDQEAASTCFKYSNQKGTGILVLYPDAA